MFGFVRRDGLVQTDVVARRSRYRIDRDPYPGSYAQIRQDFRPSVNITEYWDALFLGASSDLRIDWGLAALRVTQECDPLSGLPRILVDDCLPG